MNIMPQGGYGNRGRGTWSGNGPFRHLPPWERPGWIYGRGSCWHGIYPTSTGVAPSNRQDESQYLQSQKAIMEEQLAALQERLTAIEKRLSKVADKEKC